MIQLLWDRIFQTEIESTKYEMNFENVHERTQMNLLKINDRIVKT